MKGWRCLRTTESRRTTAESLWARLQSPPHGEDWRPIEWGLGPKRGRMCLALPVRLDEVDAGMARASLGATTLRLSLALTPDAQPGDWVLVHAGFAIQQLSEADARETWDAMEMCAEGLPPRPETGP